jgi:hypothetical protein
VLFFRVFFGEVKSRLKLTAVFFSHFFLNELTSYLYIQLIRLVTHTHAQLLLYIDIVLCKALLPLYTTVTFYVMCFCLYFFFCFCTHLTTRKTLQRSGTFIFFWGGRDAAVVEELNQIIKATCP